MYFCIHPSRLNCSHIHSLYKSSDSKLTGGKRVHCTIELEGTPKEGVPGVHGMYCTVVYTSPVPVQCLTINGNGMYL